MKKQTLGKLKQQKQEGSKFATVTAYDATFARLSEQAGIECLLIGDSLGNVIQGQSSTVPVTMEHMAYHTTCVARAVDLPFIITDMPYMSYATPEQALTNAASLMQAGGQMVKLEGTGWLAETIYKLAERGVPSLAHLGLLPQSAEKLGGYRIQGTDEASAKRILDDAVAFAEAGADMLLLECVPAQLARAITEAVAIPVIGIGAGVDTDSQVLVIYDLLGISPRLPSFSKNYLEHHASIGDALSAYAEEVKNGQFPSAAEIIA